MEWPLIEGEPLILHTAKKPEPEIPEKIECPDYSAMEHADELHSIAI